MTEDDVLCHDETDRGLAFMLSQLAHPEFPEPLGVIYAVEDREPYERLVHRQVAEAIDKGAGDLHALLHEGDTWEVEE